MVHVATGGLRARARIRRRTRRRARVRELAPEPAEGGRHGAAGGPEESEQKRSRKGTEDAQTRAGGQHAGKAYDAKNGQGLGRRSFHGHHFPGHKRPRSGPQGPCGVAAKTPHSAQMRPKRPRKGPEELLKRFYQATGLGCRTNPNPPPRSQSVRTTGWKCAGLNWHDFRGNVPGARMGPHIPMWARGGRGPEQAQTRPEGVRRTQRRPKEASKALEEAQKMPPIPGGPKHGPGRGPDRPRPKTHKRSRITAWRR